MKRYTFDRARGALHKPKALVSGNKITDVTNEDLMLALVVLQRQLKSIEARLRELEKKERDK